MQRLDEDLFPAHAGMIPACSSIEPQLIAVPRTRGDDPNTDIIDMTDSLCSPHTRG